MRILLLILNGYAYFQVFMINCFNKRLKQAQKNFEIVKNMLELR